MGHLWFHCYLSKARDSKQWLQNLSTANPNTIYPLSIFLIKPRFLFVSRLSCMAAYFKSPMTSPAGWGHCGTCKIDHDVLGRKTSDRVLENGNCGNHQRSSRKIFSFWQKKQALLSPHGISGHSETIFNHGVSRLQAQANPLRKADQDRHSSCTLVSGWTQSLWGCFKPQLINTGYQAYSCLFDGYAGLLFITTSNTHTGRGGRPLVWGWPGGKS